MPQDFDIAMSLGALRTQTIERMLRMCRIACYSCRDLVAVSLQRPISGKRKKITSLYTIT